MAKKRTSCNNNKKKKKKTLHRDRKGLAQSNSVVCPSVCSCQDRCWKCEFFGTGKNTRKEKKRKKEKKKKEITN